MESRMVRRPRPKSKVALSLGSALGAVLLLAGCTVGSPFTDPTARTTGDMAAVVYSYQRLGARPVSSLTVPQARTQPTMTDAMHAVIQAQTGRPYFETAATRVTNLQIAGAAGPLSARLYDPAPGRRGQPIILYFHGGGWVTGTLDTDDETDRILATQTHALVLSVAYRLAPEAKFPAAHDDAVAAYRWLLQYAPRLGADRRRIAVAGTDAGGNLAMTIAMAARDMRMPMPVHTLLITPFAGTSTRTPSFVANRWAVPLSAADVRWYRRNLINTRADLADPRLDLIDRADLHRLPTTTVISAEMDPLASDGDFLTRKLLSLGVPVRRVLYGGTTSGFFGLGAVVVRAREAEALAASDLDTTFNQIGAPPPPRRYAPVRGRYRRPVHHRVARHAH